ncbi:MAG: sulfite exporter TauE/SafE family protein [Desulfurivibrio sp.]|nr:sulfite exporter TauE/SafE family protein [Desulfurivibrio sp.]MBU3936473.1 sulfite exporter TauE/SafE family protein [Pseudomonadota bacterium]MBU4033211.1 sulfite exporter TauE/SafE family protein [Pseudomonadota bacterium]MBU4117254.1 sulfite exporter TauE/SafE family protein [Pseudomonadota bacterium]
MTDIPMVQPEILFAAGVLFFAYFIRGIAGFGSALISVPLLVIFFPVSQVVPLVGLLDWLASVSQGLPNRRLIRWPDLLPLLPFTVLGVSTGLYLHTVLAQTSLLFALSIFILLYAVYALLPFPSLHGERWLAAPAGVMGGMVGALFGTGGPFYVIYLTLRQLDKTEFRTTIATVFVIDGLCRIVGFTLNGFYTLHILAIGAGVVPIGALALWLGGRVHLRISHVAFVRLVSIILLGSGIALLVKAFTAS